jgi:putative membrane protein
MNFKTRCLVISGFAVTAPMWAMPASAVALSTTGPAQPLPEHLATPAAMPVVVENLTAGSASLVPLVAADLPATTVSTVDAGTPAGGGDIGKPVDDIDFVARATEGSRKEINAARDALPLLTDPGLKRIAESLIQDHGNANARLARLAEAKMWPLPAPARHSLPPAGTSDPDFDANWAEDMISAHERSAALYSAQAQGGEDPDLRKYARDTLPTIQNHLVELRRLQK